MQKFEVTMKLDDNLKDQNNILPNVRVDLVSAADGPELDRYLALPVESWLAEKNELRQEEKSEGRLREYLFGPGLSNPQTLAVDDGIWDKWDKHNSMNLVIFASIPLKEGGDVPKEDPRRFVVPLGKCRWDTDKIKITLRAGGIDIDPQPSAKP